MKPNSAADWPVLRRYGASHLHRIALPLGGIGTGTISLGGRGDLRDWELLHRPNKGFSPAHSFFSLYARPAGGPAVTRVLEGPIEPFLYEGASGCAVPNHGLPRFRQATFGAAYPFGQVWLSDPAVPLAVRLEAFNPLVPAEADRSGLPVAILRFVLQNRTARPVAAAVCGTLENFIGGPGKDPAALRRVNEFRDGGLLRGIFLRADGLAAQDEQFGTLALATTARSGITQRTTWANPGCAPLLAFWDDFRADGALDARVPESTDLPMASLAVSLKIPPRSQRAVTFLLTWHFPNRQTWTPPPQPAASPCECAGECGPASASGVGNYYALAARDAWDVAQTVAADLPRLEAETLLFVRSFCGSDLPAVVKEAALFNLSTLRTQTCFRTADGHLFGWEGCGDKEGCCHGSCTHVWNYEQATPFLFGELSRRMREVEFLHATAENGLMSFRVTLPLARATEFGRAAADGQMGCLMKLYRDWQLAGDDALLRALWPKARRALEFCWIPGGWDADRDGVMEGCQHNTMDCEYYGPNPQMQAWYLGALRAVEEMARHLGETGFADACRDLFTRGSRWMDAHLFNGAYYEQEIRPPANLAAIAPGLRLTTAEPNLTAPDFQLGAGCLVDQLVGQYLAHICGLGYLLAPGHVRTTLRSIRQHNFLATLWNHANHMRSFALGDESALLMASYPRGRRPRLPFPYYTEVMTGFEYTAAVGMLYENLTADGLRCLRAVRDRYDGRKRNPFNEAECGHHYVRAMAAWAAVLAWTGFHYSAVTQTITFAPRPGRHFWSNGYAWGTCALRRAPGGWRGTLKVLHGRLTVQQLVLTGVGAAQGLPGVLAAGQGVTILVAKSRRR